MTKKEENILAIYQDKTQKLDALADICLGLAQQIKRKNNLEDLGFEALLKSKEEKENKSVE